MNASGSRTTSGSRTKSILIAALGGEGGGVLSDWTLTAIRNAGYLAQSTSIQASRREPEQQRITLNIPRFRWPNLERGDRSLH